MKLNKYMPKNIKKSQKKVRFEYICLRRVATPGDTSLTDQINKNKGFRKMITKQELKEVLQKYQFDEKQIEMK